MFLYWKKRGAYELETLPSSQMELFPERFSWSSSLEVIHDPYDEKPPQDDECVVCQYPGCTEHRRAAKWCGCDLKRRRWTWLVGGLSRARPGESGHACRDGACHLHSPYSRIRQHQEGGARYANLPCPALPNKTALLPALKNWTSVKLKPTLKNLSFRRSHTHYTSHLGSLSPVPFPSWMGQDGSVPGEDLHLDTASHSPVCVSAGSILARNVSTRSCPPRTSPPSDLEEEEEGATERGSVSAAPRDVRRACCAERKPGKMKPKKKHRRRYTDDPSKECFTLKFDLNVDIDTEIVPAMKKKTLRELLGPVFERKGIELSRVDLFLDQSNTPLSLHFEAYPFGGHYLKVKVCAPARPGDELKVDQGVKDLRFLSLPNIKSSSGISPYILNPTNDKVDHGSLSRQDNVDILVSTTTFTPTRTMWSFGPAHCANSGVFASASRANWRVLHTRYPPPFVPGLAARISCETTRLRSQAVHSSSFHHGSRDCTLPVTMTQYLHASGPSWDFPRCLMQDSSCVISGSFFSQGTAFVDVPVLFRHRSGTPAEQPGPSVGATLGKTTGRIQTPKDGVRRQRELRAGAWQRAPRLVAGGPMVRFGRLTSWHSWDLLSMVPENLSEPGQQKPSAPCQGQARRRKNMMEFLGDASIPSPDSLAQLGGSLPSVAPLGVPKNRPASRFSGFFFPSGAGKELDRVELLNNRLQFYTYNGLPKVSSFHQDSWEEDDEEPGLTLEDSWQQLLENPETLSRRQVHQQEAIWELIHTEATYIKKLKVITDLFLCGLLHLQDCGLLSEVEPGKLFSNIQDLVRVHATLWVQVMEPVLERARRDRSLLDPMHLLQGFQTFGSRFQPYLRYCMEEERCMEYMRSQLRDNELFRIYITWAEGNKQCARLKLADMLVKPHQRLTKYPLLLKTILKKTDEPAAKDALLSMLACVDSFINSVDTQMQQKQEQQKLAAISARVESYEAVEGGTEEVERILREFNHIDLMAPMIDTSPEETRQLHLEGALRMKEGKDSRMDVYCFLFTDLLLVTKPVKRVEKVKVIRPPLLVQNVVCRELKDPGSFVLIYLNEFKSAVAAYSFQANSAPQGRSWIDALSSAQSQLQRLRSEEGRRRRARLRQRLEDGEEDERGEESCTSTASSPRLQNKEQHHTGSSDGSTETLSVMDADESEACLDSSTLQADPVVTPMPLPDGSPVAPGSQKAQGAGEADPLPQSSERRSVSVDSAYGTLSPESLLEMQTLTATSEEEVSVGTGGGGEDEEEGERERGGDRGEELEELEDQEEEEEEEEEEEGAENRGSPCSLLSPARHLKPRRRAPVQLRLPCLQRLAFKCRSEDNLLQCVSGNGSRPLARAATEPARVSPQWPDGGLGHSRSLCELIPSSAGHKVEAPLPDMEKEESCQLSHSLPATLLADTLRRARGDYKRGQMSYGCSDAEGSCSASEENGGCGKSSPQQKKKLTMAQLYRIRTTLVLNSTLTA
ncbi:hypothetical protein P4O66_020971, partial [Electrophorus voltai]